MLFVHGVFVLRTIYIAHNFTSVCMIVVVFCSVIISYATKLFLPGDDKELLN